MFEFLLVRPGQNSNLIPRNYVILLRKSLGTNNGTNKVAGRKSYYRLGRDIYYYVSPTRTLSRDDVTPVRSTRKNKQHFLICSKFEFLLVLNQKIRIIDTATLMEAFVVLLRDRDVLKYVYWTLFVAARIQNRDN